MSAPMNDTFEDIVDVDPIDSLRAGTWALLGQLLAAPPSAELIDRLAGLPPVGEAPDVIAAAWQQLAEAARRARQADLIVEYQNVFIGVGGGEVTPYASWYLTGTLMDRPLVQLRTDLEALGIERNADCSEPEDHVAALCEIMALIVQDEDVDLDWQLELYTRYVAGWMGRFFEDLGKASSADFYRAVAAVGHAFVEMERRFYEMPA
jgi:TorA maturation chaperone TorD